MLKTVNVNSLSVVLSRFMAIAIVSMVSFLAAEPAAAQFRGWGGDLENPDITSEELSRYADLLGLDEIQREVALSLLDAYLAEFTAIRSEWSDIRDGARQEARETGGRGVWGDLMPIMEDFTEKKEKLGEQFLDDYRLLLTEDQDARWEDLERLRRRERTLQGFALLSGENVDVVRIVRDADLTEEALAAVEPMLDRYAIDLDRVLIERNKAYEEGQAKMRELMESQDFDAMNEMLKDNREYADRVRSVHMRYVRQIESALPEPSRGVIEAAFYVEAYPQIYRPSFAGRALETALQFEDLTDEQQESLSLLDEKYSREVVLLNQRWREQIDASEAERTVRDFRRGANRDPEMRMARGARREFDNQILEQVRELLTDEQKAQLPEPDDNRDWRQRGGRGGSEGRGGGRGRGGIDA